MYFNIICILVIAYFFIVVFFYFWNTLEVELICLCGGASVCCREVVDVPFGLRVRCELFVLHARLVGISLLPLDFVAAVGASAAAAAFALCS